MSQNEAYTEYDLQEFYKKEIAPKVDEIKKLCRIHKLPFFFSAAVANNDKETKYINAANSTGSNEINLYDDKFVNFLLVLQHIKLVPAVSLDTFEDDLFDQEGMKYIVCPPSDDEEERALIDIGDI